MQTEFVSKLLAGTGSGPDSIIHRVTLKLRDVQGDEGSVDFESRAFAEPTLAQAKQSGVTLAVWETKGTQCFSLTRIYCGTSRSRNTIRFQASPPRPVPVMDAEVHVAPH